MGRILPSSNMTMDLPFPIQRFIKPLKLDGLKTTTSSPVQDSKVAELKQISYFECGDDFKAFLP